MENFYKSLKIRKTAFLLLFAMLAFTGFSQTERDTVYLNFDNLDNLDGGDEDDLSFTINSPCGVVANFKVEFLYENYDYEPYINRLRRPSDNQWFFLGETYTQGSTYTQDTILNPDGIWRIWVSEQTGGVGDSTSIRISWEYDQPYAACKDTTLSLDETGNASLTASDLDIGSVGCNLSLSLSQETFTTADIGDNTITLTAEDENNVQAFCTSTVTIEEYVPANCKDTTLYVDEAGVAGIAPEDLYIGEGIDIDSLGLSQSDFDCSDVPSATVTLYIRDDAMNITECVSVVTVSDTLLPAAVCQDVTVQLDATGNYTLTAAEIDNGSADNCAISSMTLSEENFDETTLGLNEVTLTVEDESGNQSMCTSTVKVIVSENAICKDTTLYLDETGVVGVPVTELLTSTTIANIDTVYTDPDQFTCAEVGDNAVLLYVTNLDPDTAYCSSVVTVMDTLSPVVSCTDTTLYLDATGNVTLTLDHVLGSPVTDNCGVDETLLSQTAFNCESAGLNSVSVTATDNNGNQTICTSSVTVLDTLLPTAVCKDITVQLDENDLYSLDATDIDNGSSDNCGIALMSVDISELTCADAGGDTDVTLTVTDNSGNISTCVSTVTVEDVTPPALTCEETTIYLRDNGVYVLDREEIRTIAVGDNIENSCTSSDFLTLTISQRLFECEHAGMNVPVTITAKDGLGQESTCNTVIKVRDITAPVVMCESEVDVYLDETGSATLTVEEVMTNDEADSCEPTLSLSMSTFTCEDAGENTVTLTATDPSNNTSSCTTTVMVHDTIMPMLVDTIQNIEMELAAGLCEDTIDYPVPNVSDNCDVTFELVEGLGADGVFPAGTTTETWTATDPSGNSITFSFDVTLMAQVDTPMIDAIDDVLAFEGTSPVNVELTGITSGSDCVDQELTIMAMASDTDLVTDIVVNYVQGSAMGSLDLTIAPEMTGMSEITVTVMNEDSLEVSESFMVTIDTTAQNNPPFVVTPIADQVVNASYVLKIPVSSVLGEYFDDPDGDELTFDIMLENGDPLPAWAELMDDTLYAEPMIADTGCVMIVVEAADADGASATDTFEVCVEGYPVGIDQIEAGSFEVKLYPNPTTGLVNIDYKSSDVYDVELSIMDMTGKQVLRKQYSTAERITFDLKENASGMYFVKLDFDGKQVIKKVVLDKR